MHHTITKQLYDKFPPERKADFWAGYLYLKHTDHYVAKAMENLGLEHKELPPLDPAVEQLLYAMVWQVGENAMSVETSLYHGKVMRPQDARKLLTQKEDVWGRCTCGGSRPKATRWIWTNCERNCDLTRTSQEEKEHADQVGRIPSPPTSHHLRSCRQQ